MAQTCTVNAGVPYAMCQTSGSEWTLYGNANTPSAGVVATTWTVVSQPAGSNVVIAAPGALVTNVTNVVVPGQYVFQISGTCPDGSGTPMDIVRYRLDPEVPVPSIADVEICASGTITNGNFDSGINYSWVAVGFPSNAGVQLTTSPGGASLSVGLATPYSPGGNGQIILYSQSRTCLRADTIDVSICGNLVADAGNDVYICGDSWVKTGETWTDLQADEYRLKGGCATMGWTQISGPNTATITYDPNYTSYWESEVVWTNLVPGDYVFELTFTDGDPCNVVTSDRVNFYVGTGGACQNFLGNYVRYSICDGADSLYIDLVNDFGIDPSLIEAGDTIRWSRSSDVECAGMPDAPADGTLFWAIPTDDLCGRCRYTINYNCSLGCSDGITIELSKFDTDVDAIDKYLCTTDGMPVLIDNISTSFSGCMGSISNSYKVLSSPTLTEGTTYNNTSNIPPLALGTHIFQFISGASTSYPYNSQQCIATDIASVTVAGNAPAANAGTDALIPCGQTFVTLSGNDPNLPLPIMASATWSIISGPGSPQLSDIHSPTTTLSNLVLPGTYVVKYTIGNLGCGFQEDTVVIVAATDAPLAPDAGPPMTVCAGGNISLQATAQAGTLGEWSVSPSSGIVFSDLNDPNATVSGLSPSTVYTFTWTETNACGTNSANVEITTSATLIEQANAGPDVCMTVGSSFATLTGNMPTVPGAVTSWTLLEVVGSPSISLTTLSANQAQVNMMSVYGSAVVAYTIEVPGCQTTSDTVVVSKTVGSVIANPLSSCSGPGNFFLEYETTTYLPYATTIISSQYDGPAGVQFLGDPTDNPLEVYLPQSGEYIFYVQIGLGACATSYPLVVTVTESPSSVNAGVDQTVCNTYNFQLDADAPDFGGVWEVIQAQGTLILNDMNNPNASAQANSVGQYVLVWNALPADGASTGCALKDTVVIDVILDTYYTQSYSYCDLRDINIEMPFMPSAALSWSQVSGPMSPTITPIGLGNVLRVTGVTLPGVYVFRYTFADPTCGTLHKDITVTFGLPEVDAGQDEIACESTVLLSGSTPSESNSTVLWRDLRGSGAFNGPTNTTDVSYGPIPYGDTILFEYCITTFAGCKACDTLQVVGNAMPQLSLVQQPIATCGQADGAFTIYGLPANTAFNLFYTFNGVPQGPISVSSSSSGSLTQTGLDIGSYENIYVETLDACSSNQLDNFFMASPCTQNIGDFVWLDTNGDGIQDAGEAGIDGVHVFLYTDNDLDGLPDGAPISDVFTNNGGAYLFPNQPEGAYIIGFDLGGLGAGYTISPQNTTDVDADSNPSPSTGLTSTIIVSGGVDDLSIDAGVVFTPASLGNYVWYDSNGDGLQNEPASNGINGIEVVLYQETAPGSGEYAQAQTTTTANDANGNPGYYNFNITESGNYYVAFPSTNGNYVLTSQTAASATDGNSDAAPATGQSPIIAMDINGSGPDRVNPTIDAGFVLRSICGVAFNDVNRDGLRNDGDVLLEGVKVYLYNEGSSQPVDSTLTDTNGFYQFLNIAAGNYYIGFDGSTNANGYDFVSATFQNTNNVPDITDTGDSDVGIDSQQTPVFTLGNAGQMCNIDAGYSTLVLPVEMLYLRGEGSGCDVVLEWATASETDNDYYVVEHSVDGRAFSALQVLKGAGTSTDVLTYNFTHTNVRQNLNHYRIKQVDFDGTYAYTSVISVKTDCYDDRRSITSIQPNPTLNGLLKVKLYVDADLPATLEVRDVLGRLVLGQEVNLLAGNNIVDISLAKANAGVYFIKVKGEKWSTSVMNVVKID
jgi:hypothetical protein